MKKTGIMAVWLTLAALCGAAAGTTAGADRPGLSPREREIIARSDSLMYVTVLPQDSLVLRTPSRDFTEEELASPLVRTLLDKMLHTVRHPSQDGVGIAAPQVGLNRRAVWVQRFDKEGAPFECYLNVRIDSLAGESISGAEGCLSVPPLRGIVPRRSVAYVSYRTADAPERRQERVEGYTAIIFQHECDHLDGRLYIDRADSLFVSEDWKRERAPFSYDRPSWWQTPELPRPTQQSMTP